MNTMTSGKNSFNLFKSFLEYHVFLILIVAIESAEVKPYCQEEQFQAQCDHDHVILVTSAVYGRMKEGPCGVKRYGDSTVGCSADVLDLVDAYCSGKRHCEFRVFDSVVKSRNSCPKDMAAYLAVSYECLRVMTAVEKECATYNRLNITRPEGYLSSSDPRNSSVGTHFCPWVIQARSGQAIRISLLNFAVYDKNFQRQQSCTKLAEVYNEKTNELKFITLCDGKQRETEVMVVDSDLVRVQINPNLITGIGDYLIKFEALGCPDMTIPAQMTAARTKDTLQVKCAAYAQVWNLVCKDKQWLGELGVCSESAGSNWAGSLDKNRFPYGILLIVAVGVALGVFFGGILLSLVALHMKRKQRAKAFKEQLEYNKQLTLSRDVCSAASCPECSNDTEETFQRSSSNATFPLQVRDSAAFKEYVMYKNNVKMSGCEGDTRTVYNQLVCPEKCSWTKRAPCDASGCT